MNKLLDTSLLDTSLLVYFHDFYNSFSFVPDVLQDVAKAQLKLDGVKNSPTIGFQEYKGLSKGLISDQIYHGRRTRLGALL